MVTDLNDIYKAFLESNGVTTDSRNCPEGAMFIALRGERFNGNQYAAKALQGGCSCAVVDDASCCVAGDSRYLLVDNCLQTLQQLANMHRRALGTRLLAITGTNGKTTTKELTAAVLSRKFDILYTQGNLNNSIGVPLTLLRLKPGHQMGIIEMGASHPGDIKELVEIAEPDCGLITNVGRAHLEGFGSFEGVVRTKTELYDFLRKKQGGMIFINSDNSHLTQRAGGLEQVAYGTSDCDFVQGKADEGEVFMSFGWHRQGENGMHHVKTNLIGQYNFWNALAAAAVGTYFGVETADVCAALEHYVPNNGRSELRRTADNTLIVDAYNANPSSMKASVDNFLNLKCDNKMLILGDMRELGHDSAAEHQKLVDYLEANGLDDVVLVGECFAATRNRYVCVPDVTALVERLKVDKPVGKTILIKGSNGTKLYTLPEYL